MPNGPGSGAGGCTAADSRLEPDLPLPRAAASLLERVVLEQPLRQGQCPSRSGGEPLPDSTALVGTFIRPVPVHPPACRLSSEMSACPAVSPIPLFQRIGFPLQAARVSGNSGAGCPPHQSFCGEEQRTCTTPGSERNCGNRLPATSSPWLEGDLWTGESRRDHQTPRINTPARRTTREGNRHLVGHSPAHRGCGSLTAGRGGEYPRSRALPQVYTRPSVRINCSV
jgi:hypothetical protein